MGGGGTILWLVMLCGLQIYRIVHRVWAGGRTKDRLQPAGVSEDDKTINTIKDMSTRLLK